MRYAVLLEINVSDGITPVKDVGRASRAPVTVELMLTPPRHGKTTAIANRVAGLLKNGVPPASIAVLTAGMAQPNGIRQSLISTCGASASELTIDTVFGFWMRLLRAHNGQFGIPLDFALPQFNEQVVIATDLLMDLKLAKRGTAKDLAQYLVRYCMAEAYRSAGFDVGELPTDEQHRKAYDRFVEEKNRNHLLTIIDVNLLVLKLLTKHPSFCPLQVGINHIFLDDCQNASMPQLVALAKIADAGINLLLAGDDWQQSTSSFCFRPDMATTFRNCFPSGRILQPPEQYLSSDRRNSYILPALWGAWASNDRAKAKAAEWSRLPSGSPEADDGVGTWVRTWDSETDRIRGVAKAAFLAQAVTDKTENQGSAVLCERIADMVALRSAFTEHPMTVRMHGHLGADAYKHIDIVMNHLRVLETPCCGQFWSNVLEFCGVSVGCQRRLSDVAASAARIAVTKEAASSKAISLEAAIVNASDVAAAEFPRDHIKVSKAMQALRATAKVECPGKRVESLIAYVHPILKRRLRLTNTLILQELNELGRLARSHVSTQRFIDEQLIGFGSLLVRYGDGGTAAENEAVDVSLVHSANSRVWPNVHVLCPPLCGLFGPNAEADDGLQSRRRFLYTAARRAPNRLIFEVVKRPADTLDVSLLEQLCRQGRISS